MGGHTELCGEGQWTTPPSCTALCCAAHVNISLCVSKAASLLACPPARLPARPSHTHTHTNHTPPPTCFSPMPLAEVPVPAPPPWRPRCDHMRVRRGSWYSLWASSTCGAVRWGGMGVVQGAGKRQVIRTGAAVKRRKKKAAAVPSNAIPSPPSPVSSPHRPPPTPWAAAAAHLQLALPRRCPLAEDAEDEGGAVAEAHRRRRLAAAQRPLQVAQLACLGEAGEGGKAKGMVRGCGGKRQGGARQPAQLPVQHRSRQLMSPSAPLWGPAVRPRRTHAHPPGRPAPAQRPPGDSSSSKMTVVAPVAATASRISATLPLPM